MLRRNIGLSSYDEQTGRNRIASCLRLLVQDRRIRCALMNGGNPGSHIYERPLHRRVSHDLFTGGDVDVQYHMPVERNLA
jgi:hypothetical protein